VDRLNQWFNTFVFSQPTPFTYGTAGRTLPDVRWDGANNLDCGVFKNNRFGHDGRFNLQFRAEFFNIFNHPRFGIAGMQLGNATFGVVSSQANQPRLIQMALKFTFLNSCVIRKGLVRQPEDNGTPPGHGTVSLYADAANVRAPRSQQQQLDGRVFTSRTKRNTHNKRTGMSSDFSAQSGSKSTGYGWTDYGDPPCLRLNESNLRTTAVGSQYTLSDQLGGLCNRTPWITQCKATIAGVVSIPSPL